MGKSTAKPRMFLAAQLKHPWNRPLIVRSLAAPHDAVRWSIDRTTGPEEQTNIRVIYRGQTADLVGAGCGTAKLIGPWQPGRRRVDDDGDDAHVVKRKRGIVLTRWKSIESAVRLPGVTHEIIDQDLAQYRREWEQWNAIRNRPADSAEKERIPDRARFLIDMLDSVLNSAGGQHPWWPQGYSPDALARIRGHLDSVAAELRKDPAAPLARPSHLRLIIDNDDHM